MLKLVCIKCKEEKQESDFYLRKRKLSDGSVKEYPRRDCKKCSGKRYENWVRQPSNKESNRETQRQWAKNNPEKCENARLKYRFGITLEDYKKLLAKHGNKCAICEITTEEYAKINKHKFHVDHCHTTGKVRGLLCNNCNVSLGGFRDSKEILEAAIKYLEESSVCQTLS